MDSSTLGGGPRWPGEATPVGFEPTRGDPIGLAGRRLNRSAKVSLVPWQTSRNLNSARAAANGWLGIAVAQKKWLDQVNQADQVGEKVELKKCGRRFPLDF